MRRIANAAAPPVPVFYVDNVVDAMQGVKIEPGSIPVVLPPLSRMHVEYRDMAARVHRAFDVSVLPIGQPFRATPATGAALAKASPGTKYIVFIRPMVQRFAVEEVDSAQFYIVVYVGGEELTTAVIGASGGVYPDDVAAKVLESILPAYNPVALAFVLARSTSVRVFKGLPTGAAARAAKKRGEPFTNYFLLQIDDVVEKLKSAGLEEHGLGHALKACEDEFSNPEAAPIRKVFEPK